MAMGFRVSIVWDYGAPYTDNIQHTYTIPILDTYAVSILIVYSYGFWDIDRFICLELCGFGVIIHSWVEHRAQPKH
jgi:hypothetical protein